MPSTTTLLYFADITYIRAGIAQNRVELDTDIWGLADQVASHNDHCELDCLDFGIGNGPRGMGARASGHDVISCISVSRHAYFN